MNKNHPIKFYLFFTIKAIKNEYRHTYYFIKNPCDLFNFNEYQKRKNKMFPYYSKTSLSRRFLIL